MATHSSILAWEIPWPTVHGATKSGTWLSDWVCTLSSQTHPLQISYRLCFRKERSEIRKWFQREQDGGGVGGRGVYLSPQIHQQYTFRHRSACRTPDKSRQKFLTRGKEYIEPCKTQWDEGTRGENRSVSRTGIALSQWGNWRRGLIPILGQLSESEEKHLRLRVK